MAIRDLGAAGATTRGGTRGAASTGIDATVRLRMAYLPTATYHLLDVLEHPLVECTIDNKSRTIRRVRVTSFIDGYTARAVETVELNAGVSAVITQLPTLFPASVHDLNELTRATLNVMVEDLDGKVETHKTEPIWLLSRNSAPLAVRDPVTGAVNDLSRYLGAFVTPNEPTVMGFLRKVAAHHPEKRLYGYQSDVGAQAKAVFEALQQEADITYVNSVVAFNPEEGASTQRVRLPRQSIVEKQANCVDGALLFASLLEAASLSAAVVIVPQHAMVGWELAPNSGQWQYLETTMIGTNSFDDAVNIGGRKAAAWEKQAETTGNPLFFRRLALRELRSKYMIIPLE